MDSIQINTGEKRIAINGDSNNVIIFNPTDVMFAERFYRLIGSFQKKLTQYQGEARELEKNVSQDEYGIPLNAPELLELTKSGCLFVRSEIDGLFGEGTSQKVFGDTLSMDAFTQFFDGMSPFFQVARSDKLQKYTRKHKKVKK